jgi:Asp-tRNA(Asn)/Glu-tRNA(Gln) amidotransferase A subunit family amidase
MKPTRGRAPTTGGIVGDANVDLGISRSVRDSATLLDAIAYEKCDCAIATTRNPGLLRIAVVRGPMLGRGISDEARAALDQAVQLCKTLGHQVSDDEPKGIDYQSTSYALLLLFASKIGWHFGAGNPTPNKRLSRGDIEPATQAMLTIARVLPMDELTTAVHDARALTQAFAEFMQRYDVMLTPTLAAPPVRIGELALTRSEEFQIAVLNRVRSAALMRKAAKDISARMFDWLPYTPIFNLTGQPAMNVPLYWTEQNLPVGVEFAGRWNDEATLFSLAGQLERAQPWFDRRPPVWSGAINK